MNEYDQLLWCNFGNFQSLRKYAHNFSKRNTASTLSKKIQSTQKVTWLNQNEAQRENKLYYFSYLFKGEFKTISKCHDDNSKNLWLITVTWYLQKSYSRALTHVWKTRNLNYFLRKSFERQICRVRLLFVEKKFMTWRELTLD